MSFRFKVKSHQEIQKPKKNNLSSLLCNILKSLLEIWGNYIFWEHQWRVLVWKLWNEKLSGACKFSNEFPLNNYSNFDALITSNLVEKYARSTDMYE